MSGSRESARHFADLLAPLGSVTLHRFFGGWGLSLRGTQFAMVMDTLYFCVDDRTRPAYVAAGSEPFSYAAGGRRVEVRRYYRAAPDTLDDEDALGGLARDALRVAQGTRQ